MKNREKNNDNIFLKNVLSTLLYGALAFLALFVLWGAAYVLVGNPLLVPPLKETLAKIGEVLKEKEFYNAYFATLSRVFAAFFISFLPAAALAVAAYFFAPVRKIAAVFVSALRSLPAMAILLMLLVWSTPGKAPVIMAFLSLFPLLYTGILAALFSIDEKYKRVCKVFCVPLYKRVFGMYLPQISPQVLRESAGALAFSVKLVVSAEVVARTAKSLGGMIQEAKIFYETEMPRMFALTLLAVLTGLILETLGNIVALAAERKVK